MSTSARERYTDPAERAKRSAISKAMWEDSDFQARMREIHDSPEWRAKCSIAACLRLAADHSRVSSLEELIADTLDMMGIDFIRQVRFSVPDGTSCVADFHLPQVGPSRGTVIEVQGDWWHPLPATPDDGLYEVQIWKRDRDVLKRQLYATQGVELLEIWERDLDNAADIVLAKLKELRRQALVA